MKIITTTMHRLIPASLLVVAGFNFAWATEPYEIIDFYADAIKEIIISEKGSTQKTKIAGNVISYKNCAEQTIVLKSGNYFTKNLICDYESNGDVIVVPLKDVVAIVGALKSDGKLDSGQNVFEKYEIKERKLIVLKNRDEESIVFDLNKKEIENYTDLVVKKTRDKWKNYFTELYNTHDKANITTYNFSNVIAKIKAETTQENLVVDLMQLRHTEFQINGFLNAFDEKCPTYICKKNLQTIDKNRDNLVLTYAKLLQLLLPKNLAFDREDICEENMDTEKVYSLFEACDSCKLVPWLNSPATNKNYFLCKVLDKQVLKDKAILNNYYKQNIIELLQEKLKKHEVDLLCKNFEYKKEEKKIVYSKYWYGCECCLNFGAKKCKTLRNSKGTQSHQPIYFLEKLENLNEEAYKGYVFWKQEICYWNNIPDDLIHVIDAILDFAKSPS